MNAMPWWTAESEPEPLCDVFRRELLADPEDELLFRFEVLMFRLQRIYGNPFE